MAPPQPPPVPFQRDVGAAEIAAGFVAIGLTGIQFFTFLSSFEALNQARADRSQASLFAFLTLLLAATAIGCVAWAVYRLQYSFVGLGVGTGLGIVAGLFVAPQIHENFGFLGEIGWLMFEAFAVLVLLLPGILGIVYWFGESANVGWSLAGGVIGIHAAGWATLAITILLNLEELARRGEQANSTPAWGLIAAAAVVGAAALAVRSRVRP